MDEGGLAPDILVNLTRQGTQGDLRVRIDVVDGSATPFVDFTLNGGLTQFITIPDGSSFAQVSLGSLLDDSDAEGTETIVLRLTHVTPGIPLGQETTLVLTIEDDDAPVEGAIQFQSPSGSVDETSGNLQIALTRTGGATGVVTAEVAVVGGFAVPGMDYTLMKQVLTWADQDTSVKFLDLTILNDSLSEGGEQVVFEIINATGGAVVGTIQSFDLDIVDDDAGGEIKFLASQANVNEGDTITVTLVRTGGSGGTARVDVRDAGTGTALMDVDFQFDANYVPGSGETVIWADGEIGPKSISVTVASDILVEPTETVQLELVNPVGDVVVSNSEGTTELRIQDVNTSSVGSFVFGSSDQVVPENAASVSILVNRVGAFSQAVNVFFQVTGDSATAGLDFADVGSGTLSWGDGDMLAKVITIPLQDDTLIEGDESFHVALTGANAGATITPDSVDITITDNDFAPWALLSIPTTATIRGIDFFGPDFGWAVGDGGQIWERSSSPTGGTWTQRSSGTNADLRGLIGDLSLGAIAVGASGTIVVADAASNNVWIPQTSGTIENLNAVTYSQSVATSQIRYHVVGNNGTILRSADSFNWTAVPSGTTEDLQSVFFFDFGRGWAVGENGIILRTIDGGLTWSTLSSGTTEDLHDVYFWDPQRGVAIGKNGTILGTTSGGDFWFPRISGTMEDLLALDGKSVGTSLTIRLVGTNGTILSSTDSGTNWSPQLSMSAMDYYCIDFVTPSRGYVGGAQGEVQTAHGGGF